VVLAIGAAGVAVWLMKSLGEIDRYDEVAVDAAPAGEPVNYLVVGSDSRGETTERDADGNAVTGQRSDTIMVLRLDPGTGHADMLSIPRDLWLPIADTGDSNRINSAYSKGRQVLLDTIKDNFGIEINHYVEIDFEGFKQLVDAIDGVSLWFEDGVRDKHSGLYVDERGCVTLDGEQALAFARSRHMQYMTPDGWSKQDPYADLGRIQRQQVFIRRALAKALDKASSNPLTFRSLVSIGVKSVGIDAATDPLDLASQFRDFDTEDLTTYSLPIKARGDGATVALDKTKAEPILAVFRGEASTASTGEGDTASGDADPGSGSTAAIDPGSVEVTVLNGTKEAGRAAEVADEFQAAGFVGGTPDNIPAHSKTTVYHHPDEADLAAEVARYIEGGAELAVDENLDISTGEVVVAIGDDFTSVLTEPASDPVSSAGAQEGESASGGPGTTTTTAPLDSVPEVYDEFTVGDPPDGVRC
jgi:LCP family protein required for cell wall assembly